MTLLIVVSVALIWFLASTFGAIFLGGVIRLRDHPPTQWMGRHPIETLSYFLD